VHQPVVAPAAEAKTMVEALEWHVARNPDRVHVTILQDENIVLATMTYGELSKEARAVAAGLIACDVVPGDRIALMCRPSGIFRGLFRYTLYRRRAGTDLPAMQLSQLEDFLRRQAKILRNAEARLLVTVPEALRLGGLLRGLVPSLSAIESVGTLMSAPAQASLPKLDDPAATALIQYTSGSTGDPKGVVLSHANLLANIRAMFTAIDATSADVLLSWLPLYHDMGLIGAWLAPLYVGGAVLHNVSAEFSRRPQSWLWASHRYRATISAAPNFAFELCLKQIDDADLSGLDLSSLRFVANGAEPISIHTLRRFIERFSQYGFRSKAHGPGLWSCRVCRRAGVAATWPRTAHRSRQARGSEPRGVAEPASADDANAVEVVDCGHPLLGHENSYCRRCRPEVEERREGRLEFRGSIRDLWLFPQ